MRITAIASGRILASLAQAVNLLLLARGTGVATFGAVSALLGLSAFVTIATDFGFSSLVLRERVLNPSSKVVAVSTWMAQLGGLLVSFAIAAVWLVSFRDAVTAMAGVGLIVFVGVDRIAEFWTALAVADGRERIATTSMIGRRLIPLIVGLVALGAGWPIDQLTIYGCISALTSVAMIAWVPAHLDQLPPRVRPQREDFLQAARQGLPFWISTTASQTRDLEGWLVSRVSDLAAAGSIGVAARLARPFALLSQAIAQPLLPMAAGRGSRFARKAVLTVFVTGVAGSAAAALALPFLPALIQVALGADYISAIGVSAIALTTAGVIATATPLGAILQARGRQASVAAIGAIANVLSLACLGLATHFLTIEYGVALSASLLIAKSIAFFVLGIRDSAPLPLAHSANAGV